MAKKAKPLAPHEVYCRATLAVNGHPAYFTVQTKKLTSAHARELVEHATAIENSMRLKAAGR